MWVRVWLCRGFHEGLCGKQHPTSVFIDVFAKAGEVA